MSSLSVSASGAAADAIATHVPELVADRVASKLFAQDATLWGPEAEPESRIRLSWVGLPRSSRPLVGEIEALRDDFAARGLAHVVLCGMGGSSLAPEVICATAGKDLVVLDSSDPDYVRRALGEDLEHTVVVVSSKSGSTVETDSQRRAYEGAFSDAGIDPATRIVVVTDPGSPLDTESRAKGYRVVNADPDVGGRYSALSAFGLVPSALAGADVERLLADARVLRGYLGADEDNPGLELGAALGEGARQGMDKLAIADGGSGIVGFGDWAEQLIAESTGKDGRGLLPVVVESPAAPGFAVVTSDTQRVLLGPGDSSGAGSVSGSLGAQLLLWEYATAVAGRVIGINPFDQPNVAESKENTKAILDESGDGPLPEGEPALVDGAVEVYGDPTLLGGAAGLADAVQRLQGAVPESGYLAVMAYLDRHGDSAISGVRPSLARRLGGRATTFGWGPRFLHSTGQFHKGGPQVGVFLQVTGAVADDVDVPGRPYTFGRLQLAQALGDLRAIGKRGRPVLRLHLRDRAAGVQQLLSACEAAT
jgi:glucose-6-phosphate isomerase